MFILSRMDEDVKSKSEDHSVAFLSILGLRECNRRIEIWHVFVLFQVPCYFSKAHHSGAQGSCISPGSRFRMDIVNRAAFYILDLAQLSSFILSFLTEIFGCSALNISLSNWVSRTCQWHSVAGKKLIVLHLINILKGDLAPIDDSYPGWPRRLTFAVAEFEAWAARGAQGWYIQSNGYFKLFLCKRPDPFILNNKPRYTVPFAISRSWFFAHRPILRWGRYRVLPVIFCYSLI